MCSSSSRRFPKLEIFAQNGSKLKNLGIISGT